jgi:hypothetical protein
VHCKSTKFKITYIGWEKHKENTQNSELKNYVLQLIGETKKKKLGKYTVERNFKIHIFALGGGGK